MFERPERLGHRVVLGATVLALVAVGTGFGLAGGSSLPAALAMGTFVGVLASTVVGLLYLALALGTPRQIRLFRAAFVALVGVGVAANLAGGRSLSDAVAFGLTGGALSFIPVMIVLSALTLLYWFGFRRSRTTAS